MTTTDTSPTLSATDLPLTGRVAVVTGAGSGIGAATAARLAADGAAVALVGRRAERLDEIAAGIESSAGVVTVAADVADADAVAQVAERVRAELGVVDLVCANAGAMLAAPFESAPIDQWDRMLDVNLRGLLLTGRAFIDDLLAAADRGARADLVVTGSIGSRLTFPTYGVYCATKAAVAHLARNLRVEYGPRGVRVKNIEPGLTDSELGDDMSDAAGREVLATMRTRMRSLDAADIAAAIAFAVAAPAHVNVAELIVVPTGQG
jgi:NADP-dependent 3-hydroxy acid dehydrogenase YdfG